MVKKGDVLVFSADSESKSYMIDSVSTDGKTLTIVEGIGALQIGQTYTMTAAKTTGTIFAKGCVDGVKRIEETIEKADPGKNLKYLIKLDKPFSKSQKRAACRQDCNIRAKLMASGAKRKKDAVIVDISAGGAKVLCSDVYEKGNELEIEATINGTWMVLNISVVSVDKLEAAREGFNFVMRAKFVNISSKEEEVIVKFIFSEYRRRQGKAAR